jgi:4-hydroxybutyrate dehydrogenase/sulfolactaldehyde 3-reductase
MNPGTDPGRVSRASHLKPSASRWIRCGSEYQSSLTRSFSRACLRTQRLPSSCAFNAEALALSQRFGLSLEKTLDVIHGTTATNGQLKMAWPAKVLKGDTEPGFTIDLAHKDLTLIVQAANAAQVPVPIAAAARESFSTARAQGQGPRDFSAMADVWCDLAHAVRPRLP